MATVALTALFATTLLMIRSIEEGGDEPLIISDQIDEMEDTAVRKPYTCDANGNKICKTGISTDCSSSETGETWDDRACMCVTMFKCRMFCPDEG